MKTIIKTSAFILFLIILQSCKKDNPTPPVITTAAVTNVSYTTASSGGEVTDDGGASIITKGICWNTSPNPTTSNSISAASDGLGSFTCQITSLTANATYYVRAYATNSAGTSYGNEVSFTTSTPIAPSLTTKAISSLTVSSFSSGGTITSNGGVPITSLGLCWSSTKNPTITDNKTTESSNDNSFNSSITGLMPNSIYYIRAYATNSVGTSYGNELAVYTYAVTDIEGNGYHSITIGTQTWMKENLKVTKYSNGDPIETTLPVSKDISTETSPKYQWAYDGNEANAAIYGRLYTWFAVNDNRNVCPSGWHVSTDTDWYALINWLVANGYNYDGGTAYAGFNKLGISLSDTVHWTLSNVPGSIGNNDYPEFRNKTGFSALPAGFRMKTGQFGGLGSTTGWWTSTEATFNPNIAWAGVMNYDGTYVIVNGYLKQENANPVRCIKN